MSVSRCCCTKKVSASPESAEPPAAMNTLRRCGSAAAWGVPALGLALMPKCPVCVAGYVALATGVSVSAATGAWVRWGVVLSCAAVLVYLVVRSVRMRMVRARVGCT